MLTNERERLTNLITRARVINDQLYAEEKKFTEAVYNSLELGPLQERYRKLSNLIRKERLYLGASDSLLQAIMRNS